MANDIGILLTNIGTPDAPNVKAVKNYLKEFLSDPRVVELPRWIWWPILYGIILPIRPRNSAKLYQKIWTQEGSPLLYRSQQLMQHLEAELPFDIALGMHYGNPSIKHALSLLQRKNLQKILVLPLYPHYSATSTGSTFDIVTKELHHWRKLPEIRFIIDYAESPSYIHSLCQSIHAVWQQRGPEHLLFSFHGIPKRYADAGDPYPERCRKTVELVTQQLRLSSNHWSMSFQSRLGRAEWLTPYTADVLSTLPKRNIKKIQVICPGFAVDCLETLEEIAIQGKKQFIHAGGEDFYYIPALNDQPNHITTLKNLILSHVQKW